MAPQPRKTFYSDNDMTMTADGRLVRGTLSIEKEKLEEQRDRLAAEIEEIAFKELPMLEGKGFIVIDPKNPRFTGVEYGDMTKAEEEAQDVAYSSGRAIIYAPISVIRPKREVAVSQPSELLKQLGTRTGEPTQLPAGELVKTVEG